MSDAPDEPDRHDEVLGSVDSLMARHRPPPAQALRPAPPPVESDIPVLTDLVSLGSESPPAASVPVLSLPAAPPPPLPTLSIPVDAPEPAPAAPPPPAPVAAAPAEDPDARARALEAALAQRLQERLDREIGLLLDRRVVPEIAGALDFALGQVAADLKGTIRQMVREALEDTLASLLQDQEPPRPPRS